MNKMKSTSTLSEFLSVSSVVQQRLLKSQKHPARGGNELKSNQVTAEQFSVLCSGSQFLTWKIKGRWII